MATIPFLASNCFLEERKSEYEKENKNSNGRYYGDCL